jgi:dTDP-4-dehydrorhamnose reductase
METPTQIEIWAGVESTINRVEDTWHDQCERNGHGSRIEDIDLFASLGVKKLRYPVLWEKAHKDGDFDFDWVAPRLQRLWDYGIEPIATLLQHGSGPEHTSLIDSEFPMKLAQYAKAAATRFPQLRMYTPVNEPLTTARFSGLYGVWYPHGRSNKIMLRCLLNECKGTALAMHEIRKVNPSAVLVQTEDMGRAQGTQPCQKRVQFENQRRWLSLDLLCGRIDDRHPLYRWMLRNGVTPSELEWFRQNPCPPDIIGINHYLLSNRFLDHRTNIYPIHFKNRGAKPAYSDLGIPQVTELHPKQEWAPFIPPLEILREVADRYPIPVAVTEVQLAGARESQMQWLEELWNAANTLKDEGQDIVAVTPWSLLGSYDWNTLCSRGGNFYESGVFDVRAPAPRPTALAKMITELARTGDFKHPVLENQGYWYRQIPKGRPLLITGAGGSVGQAFIRTAEARGLSYITTSRAQMDIASIQSVRQVLEMSRPWAVINTIGYSHIDDAEAEPQRAFLENVLGSEILAGECARLKIPFMTFSTDLVFDGNKARQDISNSPYLESDVPSPLNVYGQTKAEMERRVLSIHPESMVIRTSSLFSAWNPNNFAVQVLQSLRKEAPFETAMDVVMAPTYVPDLVDACLNLLIDGMWGITHLANRGELSWSEFAREIAALFELDKHLIRPKAGKDLDWRAPRPSYSVLSSDRIQIMPAFEEALHGFKREVREQGLVPWAI